VSVPGASANVGDSTRLLLSDVAGWISFTSLDNPSSNATRMAGCRWSRCCHHWARRLRAAVRRRGFRVFRAFHQDFSATSPHTRTSGGHYARKILRPFRFRTSTLSLTEDTVLRIDEQDSVKNGVLIGVGIGAALAVVGTATCHHESCSGGAALGLMLGPLFGGILGRVVDLSVNRRVYVSSRTPRVVFEPFLGPFQAGLAARIRF